MRAHRLAVERGESLRELLDRFGHDEDDPEGCEGCTFLALTVLVLDVFFVTVLPAPADFFVDFFAVDFFAVDFFAVDFFAVDFFAVDFFAVDFFAAPVFFAVDFFAFGEEVVVPALAVPTSAAGDADARAARLAAEVFLAAVCVVVAPAGAEGVDDGGRGAAGRDSRAASPRRLIVRSTSARTSAVTALRFSSERLSRSSTVRST